MSRELATALRSTITGTLTACAIIASLWLAAGPEAGPADAATRSTAACQHWTKTGPISNANSVAVWVSDRDGAVPATRIPAHGSVSFRWTFPASVARHVDVVTVRDLQRIGRPLALTLTFTRPASCTP